MNPNELAALVLDHLPEDAGPDRLAFSAIKWPPALILPPDGVEISDLVKFVEQILDEGLGCVGLKGSLDPFFNSIPSLKGVYLTRFEVDLQDGPGSAPFFVGFQLKQASWTIIPDSGLPNTTALALSAPGFSVGSLGPGEGLAVDVYGTLEIFGVKVRVAVQWPAMIITGALVAELSLQTLLDHAELGSTVKFGDNTEKSGLKVQSLLLNIDVPQKALDLSLSLSDWTIPAAKITLHSLLLDLSLGQGQKSGSIRAQSTVAGIDLNLFGAFQNGRLEFAGSTGPGQKIPIGELMTDLVKLFGGDADLPESLHGLSISNLAMTYASGGVFSFAAETEFPLDGHLVDLTVSIVITPEQHGATDTLTQPAANVTYSKEFSGHITVGDLQFDLQFEEATAPGAQQQSTRFAATYRQEPALELALRDLVQGITSDPDLLALTPDLKLGLKRALFAYVKEADQHKAQMMVAIALEERLNLNGLPLIDKLAQQDFALEAKDLLILYATGDLSEANAMALNGLLAKTSTEAIQLPLTPGASSPEPSPSTATPPPAFNQGFNFAATLVLGEETLIISTAGHTSAVGQPSLPAPATSGLAAESVKHPANVASTAIAPANATSPAPAPDGNAKWFAIQKAFGPLHFDKIGLRYEQGNVWLLLNADLTVAGLTISPEGLALSTPLDEFSPAVHLQGLGISYQNGPVQISGAFARFEGTDEDGRPYEEYDGLVTVKTETLALSAIGSYAMLGDEPSMFVYLALDYPLGGPPFFFVTGLTGGFGYNRALKIPEAEDLLSFPFVAVMVPPKPAIGEDTQPAAPALSDPSKAVANSADIHTGLAAQMAGLQNFVHPRVGEYWFALGVHFTSFQIVDGFVLLTVAFGHRFEINLLGTATYDYPPGSNQTGHPLTHIQVLLKASYVPDEGFLEARALLAPGSYLYDPKCHLEGGIAFKSWFSGPHTDDFVLTIGGYHPRFDVPAWYPQVPRLGFNWQYSSELTIKGGAYFAMTGNALMAGGFLDVNWDSGDLRAWFKASADFLIRYKPFHYEVDLSLEIGASVTIHFFGTHHLTVELGADLHLSGPEFSGVANLHIWVASFTIAFGDGPAAPQPIDWTTFRSSFLPPADDDVVSLSVRDGLAKTVGDSALTAEQKAPLLAKSTLRELAVMVVNPKQLNLITASLVPVTVPVTTPVYEPIAYLNADNKPEHRPFTPDALALYLKTDVGIGPMDVIPGELSSVQTITITRLEGLDNNWANVTDEFIFIPLRKNVPAGLWGAWEEKTNVNGDSTVNNTHSGFEIRAKLPEAPDKSRLIDRSQFAFETTMFEHPYEWSVPVSIFPTPEPSPQANTLGASLVANKRRSALLKAFAFDSDGSNEGEGCAVLSDERAQTIARSWLAAPVAIELRGLHD